MRDHYIHTVHCSRFHTHRYPALEAASLGQLGQAASLDSLQVATIDPAQQAALAEAAADPQQPCGFVSGDLRVAAMAVGFSERCDVEISFSVTI